jgi:hypothetical protein
MMSLQFVLVVVVLSLISQSFAFNALKVRSLAPTRSLTMKVENDAFAKANRSQRRAAADDRMVELRMPMGMDLDEDKNGNVFVKSIEKGGRADKSGMVFVGDIVAMVSATFGDDMWSARGVGLDRVVSSFRMMCPLADDDIHWLYNCYHHHSFHLNLDQYSTM